MRRFSSASTTSSGFHSASLGDITLTGSGQFNKLEPGVGRLLGVLSLQSLPRRITLDFRDVFSDGFAFDSISGSMKVTSGVLRTDDLSIRGPSAKVFMSGSTDLAAETQDLRVKVQPTLSESVALGAAIAGPVAGVATLLAQKVLKDPIEKLFSYEYGVSGTWKDPQVVKLADLRPQPAPAETTADQIAAQNDLFRRPAQRFRKDGQNQRLPLISGVNLKDSALLKSQRVHRFEREVHHSSRGVRPLDLALADVDAAAAVELLFRSVETTTKTIHSAIACRRCSTSEQCPQRLPCVLIAVSFQRLIQLLRRSRADLALCCNRSRSRSCILGYRRRSPRRKVALCDLGLATSSQIRAPLPQHGT